CKAPLLPTPIVERLCVSVSQCLGGLSKSRRRRNYEMLCLRSDAVNTPPCLPVLLDRSAQMQPRKLERETFVRRERQMKKPAWPVSGLLIVAASLAVAHASDFAAVYARVDRVVLEPDAGSPEAIQIWG